MFFKRSFSGRNNLKQVEKQKKKRLNIFTCYFERFVFISEFTPHSARLANGKLFLHDLIFFNSSCLRVFQVRLTSINARLQLKLLPCQHKTIRFRLILFYFFVKNSEYEVQQKTT